MTRPCFAVLGLAALLLGCPASTSNTDLYTPITGIQIDAAQLVYGVGCGTGPGQVYRYAAVLSFAPPGLDAGRNDAAGAGAPSVIGTSGVFDCFTNGVLGNLPASDAGSLSFSVQIYAYDQASFPSALECPPGTGGPQGQTCPGDKAANIVPYASSANWTASCTAAQVTGVTIPAVCGPLVARAGAGADGGVGSSPSLDASAQGDATAGADAGVEASGD